MGKEFLVSISGKQRIRLVVCSGLVLSLDVCWADVRPTTGGSQTPLICSQVATAISVSEWGGACWADTGICCGPPWLFLVTNPEGRHPSVHHTCWNIHSATAHNSPKLGTTISHWERTTHRHALQMSLTYIERKMPSTERHRSIYAKHKRQLSVEKPGEVNWLWTMERIWIFP